MPNLLATNLIHKLFEYQTIKTPDAVAVVFKDLHLTYRELNQKANQVAHYLKTLNVGPEVRVGVCLERSLEMLIALLGILKAGGAYVPLDPTHPRERNHWVLQDAQVPVIVTQQHLVKSLPNLEAQMVCLDTEQTIITQYSSNNLELESNPNHLAYIIYTSGSTGKPKGVQVVHRTVVNLLQSIRVTPGLNPEDRLVSVTTICFDTSVCDLFLPLMVGARIIIAPCETTQDAVGLAHLLQTVDATVMQATPATWQMLQQSGWQGTPQLRIWSTGEALPRPLANWLLKRGSCVWNLYGPTETTIWATTYQVNPGEGSVSIGHPIANTQVYVLDEQLQPVGAGEIGELYIGGAGVARGYLNRPDLNAERFMTNPFSENTADRIYKTGDLVRQFTDGNLECLGRIDHQVKIRGFRIELGEIEALLLQHRDVNSAVVMAETDRWGHQRLIAYVASDLLPERIPYQSIVVIETDGCQSLKLTTDISATSLGLVGVPSSWKPNQSVRLHLTLPGKSIPRQFYGTIAWCQDDQARIELMLSPAEKALLQTSIDWLLETQAWSKQLQQTLIKNLRDTLKNQLPHYMVPSHFVVLNRFPLTPTGKVDRNTLSTYEKLGFESEDNPIAPRTAVEQELVQLWQQVLDLESVSIDDNFYDLGGHSLSAIRLMTQINQTFEIELPLSCFLEQPTIAGLAEVIETLHQSVLEPIDSITPSLLDPSIVPETILTEPIPNFLLTGATGFLGAYLLYELLQQTQADLYCLVRAASLEDGRTRIQTALKHYQLWQDSFDVRIIPVLGDLSQSQLGLKPEQFSRLAEKIDIIYHCGAWVNLLYPYSALEATNVTGTQEVLRLASLSKIKPVHFISTVDVFACDQQLKIRTVGEQDAIGPGETLSGGYAQSQYVAETLVMTAYSRGIPVAIYRLSNIMGASQTGICHTRSFMTKMIEGCIQMGIVPELEAALNLVPVDYASRAIVHLSLTQPLQGQAFHIVNPQPLMWSELVELMTQLGYPLEWVSYDAWQTQLRHQAANVHSANPLTPFLALFSHRDLIQKSLGAFSFNCDQVLQGLADTNIVCPAINKTLLMTYFCNCLYHGWFEGSHPKPQQIIPYPSQPVTSLLSTG